MTAATSLLQNFSLTRILDQDPKSKSANLLGTIKEPNGAQAEQVILILERLHFPESFLRSFSSDETTSSELTSTYPQNLDGVSKNDANGDRPVKVAKVERREDAAPASRSADSVIFANITDLGQNDIYTWLLAWLPHGVRGGETAEGRDADLKITMIRPATQTHIDKYSAQKKVMVYETPEMYSQRVVPWIESFPPSRLQWVYTILEHKKETESILYEDPDPQTGFIIVPDLKWDQKSTSSLYIQAIVHNRNLKSIRDLTKQHVGMLKQIGDQASKVAFHKFGLSGRVEGAAEGNVRCFLHYQPSYYHLHVHILASSYTSHSGAIVGQAHLLEDVIDLLNLGVDFQQRTFAYALGTNSKLWDVLYPASSSSSSASATALPST